MKVEPNTKIRVKAIGVGNYVGQDGDIIVCNPEGVDPLARYPRIMAKDLEAGILAQLISVNVDRDQLAASDDEGNHYDRYIEHAKAKIGDIDLSALAEMEAENAGTADKLISDMIAHPKSQATEVSIGGAVVEGDNGGGAEAPTIYHKHKAGGVYQVFAPWLQDPIEVKGREAADAEVTRLTEEGEPPQV